jgi:hypothetical protein
MYDDIQYLAWVWLKVALDVRVDGGNTFRAWQVARVRNADGQHATDVPVQ